MKSCVFCIFLTLAPAVVRGEGQVHIRDVGLQGIYSTSLPTPVRIHIPALSEAETIQLYFTIDSDIFLRDRGPERTDRFQMPIQVSPGTPSDIEIPLPCPPQVGWGGSSTLKFVATDSRGNLIGQETIELRSEERGLKVAIYCNDDRQCLDAQTQISPIPSGEEGQNEYGELSFVLLKEPRVHWWAYASAQALVVAGSVSRMNSQQRLAVEDYLRGGGWLFLLEKEAADPSFLAAYREGTPTTSPVHVGLGYLYRVSSLESKDLSRLFPAYGPKQLAKRLQQPHDQASVGELLERVGVTFHFPRLLTLILWIAVYILIVGLANFALLRSLRRLEWGWVTVCGVAIFFAAGLYFINSSRRPKNFTLDSAVIYWMDGHSPIARSDLQVRISSPKRTRVKLQILNDFLLAAYESFDNPSADIGGQITHTPTTQQGWQARLGNPMEIDAPMLGWSFKNFSFAGFREFSGPLHWISPMHLRNDTGQKFKEAIYLDYNANRRYTIGAIGPGEEIDLSQLTAREIRRNGEERSYRRLGHRERAEGEVMNGAFSVEELPDSSFSLGWAGGVFAGVLDAPLADAKLDMPGSSQQAIALAIVNLNQQ